MASRMAADACAIVIAISIPPKEPIRIKFAWRLEDTPMAGARLRTHVLHESVLHESGGRAGMEQDQACHRQGCAPPSPVSLPLLRGELSRPGQCRVRRARLHALNLRGGRRHLLHRLSPVRDPEQSRASAFRSATAAPLAVTMLALTLATVGIYSGVGAFGSLPSAILSGRGPRQGSRSGIRLAISGGLPGRRSSV